MRPSVRPQPARLRRTLHAITALAALGVAGVAAGAAPVAAQPTAGDVLTALGFSAADQQRVLAGELVTTDAPAVADTDLAIAIAFTAKAAPAVLADQVLAGAILADDPQVRASGAFRGGGLIVDLATLQMAEPVAQAFIAARPGETLNLSTTEIAAFNALAGAPDPQHAGQDQLRKMLLARFRAYQKIGLAGIAPYARDGGESDPATELRKASTSATVLEQYLPALQTLLLEYPNAKVAGLRDDLYWASYDIDGTPTFVLAHRMAAPLGAARVIVQRQYYVSTGYNAEQAIAGFLPVEQGTLVAYVNHTFTDQVGGFGGAVKRSVGRRMMARKLEAVFAKSR